MFAAALSISYLLNGEYNDNDNHVKRRRNSNSEKKTILQTPTPEQTFKKKEIMKMGTSITTTSSSVSVSSSSLSSNWKRRTPCGIFMELLNQHSVNQRREQYRNDPTSALFQLCRTLQQKQQKQQQQQQQQQSHLKMDDGSGINNAVDPNEKISDDDDDEKMMDMLLLSSSSSFVYNEVRYLLENFPHVIHSVDSTGQNALHILCSNPYLLCDLKLIHLLVSASEQVTDDHDYYYDEITSTCSSITSNGSCGTTGSSSGCREGGTLSSLMSSTRKKQQQQQQQKQTIQLQTVTTTLPTCSKILRELSLIRGQLPLHIACQYAHYCTLDVYEYFIVCHPSSVCTRDKIQKRLPLHYACCNLTSITNKQQQSIICDDNFITTLELIMLLVQQWPEGCKIQDRDGNLPLHLAAQIANQRMLQSSNQQKMKSSGCNSSHSLNIIGYESIGTISRMKQFQNLVYNQASENEIDSLDDLNLDNTSERSNTSSSSSGSSIETALRDIETTVLNAPSSTNVRTSSIENLKLPKSYIIEKMQQEQLDHDNQKENDGSMYYPDQLEIVRYLVDKYPGALQVRNKLGLTPYQIAVQSSSKYLDEQQRQQNCLIQTVIRNGGGGGGIHNDSLSTTYTTTHPVLEFLRDPTSYALRDNKIPPVITRISTTSGQRSSSIYSSTLPTNIPLDTTTSSSENGEESTFSNNYRSATFNRSGREYDEHSNIKEVPWNQNHHHHHNENNDVIHSTVVKMKSLHHSHHYSSPNLRSNNHHVTKSTFLSGGGWNSVNEVNMDHDDQVDPLCAIQALEDASEEEQSGSNDDFPPSPSSYGYTSPWREWNH